jgi:hypothetical protein
MRHLRSNRARQKWIAKVVDEIPSFLNLLTFAGLHRSAEPAPLPMPAHASGHFCRKVKQPIRSEPSNPRTLEP